jgi:TfoX/Sxy family transcriptional regulator of competence genes
MTSDLNFVEFIVEQINPAGTISYRKMFGEYALYCDGKVVALICDNQLYVKPTASGKKYVGKFVEAPPYPGAKMYLLIENNIENCDWMGGLIRVTADELPVPKPKQRKAIRTRKNSL